MPVRTLRILLVTNHWGRVGGTETHVVDLVSALTSDGHDVRVVADTASPGAGGRVYLVPGLAASPPSPEGLTALSTWLADNPPDVVHLHTMFDESVREALRAHAPIVQSAHNYWTCSSNGQRYFSAGHECHRPHGPGCLANAIGRNCGHRKLPRIPLRNYEAVNHQLCALRSSDAVVAYSSAVADDLRRNDVGQVTTIPLFVPARHGAPQRGGDEQQRVLFVGRITDYKGLHTLIRAIARTPLTLEVCGVGPELQRNRRLASRLRVADRVVFTGWTDPEGLDAAFGRCAVLAVPSLWPEPFGLVGLDAMSRGVPVVASNTGGIPDWLEDGRNGVLIPPGDVDELARALTLVCADHEGLARMGAAGRARAVTEFSAAVHTRRLNDLYQRTFDQRRVSQTTIGA
jgi:glycosyltransferase involved in cell wall biosynthesis